MIRLLQKEEKPIMPIVVVDPSMTRADIITVPQDHYTYYTYRGDSEDEARVFLQSLPEIPPYTYYAVEVGNRAFCRDIDGVYEEAAVFTEMKDP